MKTFTRKGYGRIYVDTPEHIQSVIDEIRDMDSFEYDYLPDNFVTCFSEYPKLEFTYKFDAIDINLLTARCWIKGIYIFCLDNGHGDYIDNGF